MTKLNGLHAGEDIEFLADKYNKRIHSSRLQAMINDDPGRAAPYLEKFKDIIGPENYRAFKRQLAAGISDQNVEATIVRIEVDYDKNEDGILTIEELREAKRDFGRSRTYNKKYGLNLAESQKVRGELQNLINTRDAEEKDQIDDGTKAEHKQIVEQIVKNNYAGGLELLKKSYWLKNHDPAKWQALYNDLTTTPKDDPVLFNELWTEVNTQFDDPEMFDEKASRIWTGKYKSLSPKTKEHAHDQLRQLWKAAEDAPTAKAYYQIGIKLLGAKERKWPGKDAAERARNKFDAMTAWRMFFINNKDEIPIEKYSEQFGKLVAPSVMIEWWERIPFIGGAAKEKRIELLEQTVRETRHGEMPKPKSSISPPPKPEGKRAKAIKILQDAGKPVTEANVQYVMDNM
jgi:hypothetical protein